MSDDRAPSDEEVWELNRELDWEYAVEAAQGGNLRRVLRLFLTGDTPPDWARAKLEKIAAGPGPGRPRAHRGLVYEVRQMTKPRDEIARLRAAVAEYHHIMDGRRAAGERIRNYKPEAARLAAERTGVGVDELLYALDHPERFPRR